jgi:antitoxin FitA
MRRERDVELGEATQRSVAKIRFIDWPRNPEMSISLNLDAEQSARLEERARALGVDPHELAKAAVNDLLTRPAEDFERAAKIVLERNTELYRRLS